MGRMVKQVAVASLEGKISEKQDDVDSFELALL